jgi:superfamily II DNA or RNA helicase
MVRLWFDKGTLLLKGDIGTPYGKWDPRVGCFRIKALYYRDVLAYFEESQILFEDSVQQLPPLETLKSTVQLRPYQESALSRWRRNENRGVLVLPTAAGKTYIALKAVEVLRTQTLIVVPTLDLIDQWRSRIRECLGVESGKQRS